MLFIVASAILAAIRKESKNIYFKINKIVYMIMKLGPVSQTKVLCTDITRMFLFWHTIFYFVILVASVNYSK